MKYILRVIDFETTGIPDESEGITHSVVELGFVDIDAKSKEQTGFYTRLVKPSTEMDIEAQAVHHITHDEARARGITWDEAQEKALSCDDGCEVIFVAHNAAYEQKFFNPDGVKWIDTYKIALQLYPDAPKHTNGVLKYFLNIADDSKHHPPHRALPDCFVTAEILKVMAKELTFNTMIGITKKPPYLTVMPFGKHKGEKFDDLPRGYIEWLSKQGDFDESIKGAVARQIERGI